MKKYFYILIGVVLTMASCKKEPIPNLNGDTGSEGIYFNGTLGSEVINLNATGNYYMYSSYVFDSVKEVYVFSGELKERFCTDCGTSIKISVINYIKSPGGVVNFDFDTVFNSDPIYWTGFTMEELGLAEINIEKNNLPKMTSKGCFQPSSNSLKVKEVELYKLNELGQKTVRVEFEGQVTILTPEGEKLFTFDGGFAFAFP